LTARAIALCLLFGSPLALAWPAAAEPASPGEPLVRNLALSGVIETEVAIGIDGPDQTAALVFLPELDGDVGPVRFHAVGRLRADAFDRLEPGEPSQASVAYATRRVFIGNQVELELRELTAEGRIGDAYLVLGKQQVVWGRSDGLKVLDVVDPQNFRQFILADFDSSRVPLWTVNLEVPVGSAVLQALWVPDPTFHIIPEEGALYAFTSPRIIPTAPPGVPVILEDLDRPNDPLKDGDAGLRLSGFNAGFDWSLNYLYRYEDEPILFRTIELPATGPVARVSPGYRRTHLIGGTLSTTLGDLTLRGEAGYSTDRYFITDELADPDGVKQAGELGYVLGFDWFGIPETLLSFQLFQSWVLGDKSGLQRDQLDTNVTLLARRTFMNERLTLDGIWIHNVNDGDGLLRPKVSYEVRDDLVVWSGLDVFYGSRRGLFGQFDRRDRFVVGMQWGF
jgi:hypothetical protein